MRAMFLKLKNFEDMKTIIKALEQRDFKPRKKWWGFVKENKRFLCRYQHIMVIFENNTPVYVYQETKTDKAGVSFAIKYMNYEAV